MIDVANLQFLNRWAWISLLLLLQLLPVSQPPDERREPRVTNHMIGLSNRCHESGSLGSMNDSMVMALEENGEMGLLLILLSGHSEWGLPLLA